MILGRKHFAHNFPRAQFQILLAIIVSQFTVRQNGLCTEQRDRVDRLTNVVVCRLNDFLDDFRRYFNLFLETDGHNCGFYLFNTWSSESEIEAVIDQRTNFRMVAIVAHANNWHRWRFDQRNQLLHAAAVFVAGHAINFVHQQNLFLGQFAVAAVEVAVQRFVRQQFRHLDLQ